MTDSYDAVYKWFAYLTTQNIQTAGFVFMPNHIHCLIYLPVEAKDLDSVVGNGKRFMAYEIVKRLRIQKQDELLDLLAKGVSKREAQNGKLHQVFEPSYDAQLCISEKFTQTKLNYIHHNPVQGKWNLSDSFLDYEHSSARFYELNETHNLVELTRY